MNQAAAILGAVLAALLLTVAPDLAQADQATFYCDARAPDQCQFELYHGSRSNNNGVSRFLLNAGQNIVQNNIASGWEYCVSAGNPPPPPGTNCTLKTEQPGAHNN